MSFYHYTCDHGRDGLGAAGVCLPLAAWAPDAASQLDRSGRMPGWWTRISWFTDMDEPIRDALGLTSYSIGCDRTRFRYRVVDSASLHPWVGSPQRRSLAPIVRADLESFGKPRHWWISTEPVPVVLDLIERAA